MSQICSQSKTLIYLHKLCVQTYNIVLPQRLQIGNHVQSFALNIFKQEKNWETCYKKDVTHYLLTEHKVIITDSTELQIQPVSWYSHGYFFHIHLLLTFTNIKQYQLFTNYVQASCPLCSLSNRTYAQGMVPWLSIYRPVSSLGR